MADVVAAGDDGTALLAGPGPDGAGAMAGPDAGVEADTGAVAEAEGPISTVEDPAVDPVPGPQPASRTVTASTAAGSTLDGPAPDGPAAYGPATGAGPVRSTIATTPSSGGYRSC
ncbi:MAG TPA: hypothetical protein VFP72_21925 [Kineosporiaceae bacterium]|nr:hypothetical protein [Kineosporiaceae bacterium]